MVDINRNSSYRQPSILSAQVSGTSSSHDFYRQSFGPTPPARGNRLSLRKSGIVTQACGERDSNMKSIKPHYSKAKNNSNDESSILNINVQHFEREDTAGLLARHSEAQQRNTATRQAQRNYGAAVLVDNQQKSQDSRAGKRTNQRQGVNQSNLSIYKSTEALGQSRDLSYQERPSIDPGHKFNNFPPIKLEDRPEESQPEEDPRNSNAQSTRTFAKQESNSKMQDNNRQGQASSAYSITMTRRGRMRNQGASQFLADMHQIKSFGGRNQKFSSAAVIPKQLQTQQVSKYSTGSSQIFQVCRNDFSRASVANSSDSNRSPKMASLKAASGVESTVGFTASGTGKFSQLNEYGTSTRLPTEQSSQKDGGRHSVRFSDTVAWAKEQQNALSRQQFFEVSRTTGSLRSISSSIARNHTGNPYLDKKNFLAMKSLPMVKSLNTRVKLQKALQKLDRKAAERIQMIRESNECLKIETQERSQDSSIRQYSYPCIFMKKSRLPESRLSRQGKMESSHQGVWVQFNDSKNEYLKTQSSLNDKQSMESSQRGSHHDLGQIRQQHKPLKTAKRGSQVLTPSVESKAKTDFASGALGNSNGVAAVQDSKSLKTIEADLISPIKHAVDEAIEGSEYLGTGSYRESILSEEVQPKPPAGDKDKSLMPEAAGEKHFARTNDLRDIEFNSQASVMRGSVEVMQTEDQDGLYGQASMRDSESSKRKQRPGFQANSQGFYRNSRGYKYGSRPSPANFMMVGGPPAGLDQYLGMTKQSLMSRPKAAENFSQRDIDNAINNYLV